MTRFAIFLAGALLGWCLKGYLTPHAPLDPNEARAAKPSPVADEAAEDDRPVPGRRGAWVRPANGDRKPSGPPPDAPGRARESENAKALSDLVAEYAGMYAELGVAAERAEQLLKLVEQVFMTAALPGSPAQDLEAKRLAYDAAIRNALGPEAYQRYREMERTAPARRELVEFRNFCIEHRYDYDPEDEGKLLEVISDDGVYTTQTWFRPYDPMPRPGVDGAGLRPAIQEQIQSLASRQQRVQQWDPQDEDLTSQSRELLTQFYQAKRQSLQRALELHSPGNP